MRVRVRHRIKGFFGKLIEYRWFYTFSASATATIVGISLTFGINSCRDNHRKRAEAEESVMEAVGNISIRAKQMRQWCDLLEEQNRIYLTADSIYRSGTEIPDSVCVLFRETLPQLQTFLTDHGFEKVFRESYQLWQVLDQKKLTDLINGCFEILDYTEPLCQELLESMLSHMEECNRETPFVGRDSRFFTEAMLARPQFRLYMSLRVGKVMLLQNYDRMLDHLLGKVEHICDELGYKKIPTGDEETFSIDDDEVEARAEY